ncbi:hypothetical protein D3C77_351940 [compost metagenome]
MPARRLGDGAAPEKENRDPFQPGKNQPVSSRPGRPREGCATEGDHRATRSARWRTNALDELCLCGPALADRR